MIYGLFFRRYAPFKTFGGGFEGDNRSTASTSLAATARTIGALNFSPGNVGNMTAESSGTTFAGLGAWIQLFLGKHQSEVTSSVSVATRTIKFLRFTAQTSGANPMVPAAPSIDTYLDAQVLFRSQAIEICGTLRGDNFPNAEVFATDAAGKSVLIFEFATTGGQTTGPMARLAGDHSAQILGVFSKRIALMRGGNFA
jgi:hypothetical protein